MALIETDSLSNQDLSSRLEIASLTAGQYYKQVQAHIYIDQIAGNGDYVIDITHQRAGAGTAYRTVNVTQAVASGVTSLKSVTLPFPVNNTDVVKVYVTGLGGDTTTPDTIVEWHDVSSLTAAEVRAALGLASANLDTQLDALPTAAENGAAVLSAAQTTPIESNIKKINDTSVAGNGSTTPWGPA